MTIDPRALLDQPPLAPDELTRIEQLTRAVLATANDVVIVQGEAILALESVARSVGAPGRVALNVVTGPYGALFGAWMREAGSEVVDVVTDFDAVVTLEAVTEAISAHAPSVLAIVHAEAATGGTNPLSEVIRVARAAGLLTIVDAVASIGAEPVLVDDWGIDIAVIGAQKALAGPAGVSAVALSETAWSLIDATPGAPRKSALSLLDHRDGWLRTDRRTVLGMPAWLESRAYAAALQRVLDEGLSHTEARHRWARAATLAGAARLGIEPWQRGAAIGYAPIATALRLPDGTALGDGAVGGITGAGAGLFRGRLMRINHTGRAAELTAVLDALDRMAGRLRLPADSARAAAASAWHLASHHPAARADGM